MRSTVIMMKRKNSVCAWMCVLVKGVVTSTVVMSLTILCIEPLQNSIMKNMVHFRISMMTGINLSITGGTHL